MISTRAHVICKLENGLPINERAMSCEIECPGILPKIVLSDQQCCCLPVGQKENGEEETADATTPATGVGKRIARRLRVKN